MATENGQNEQNELDLRIQQLRRMISEDVVMRLDKWLDTQNRVYGTSHLGSVERIWDKLQLGWNEWIQVAQKMAGIHRWGRMALLRRQSVLAHSYALAHLADNLLPVPADVSRPTELDRDLLLLTCLVHDIGEGLQGFEVCAPQKTEDHELSEVLLALQKINAHVPGVLRDEVREAYLLGQQKFVLQQHRFNDLPGDNPAVLDWLSRNKQREAWFFSHLERLEYVLFALAEVVLGKHDTVEGQQQAVQLFKEVVEENAGRLDVATEEFPNFGNYWTPDIARASRRFCGMKTGW